MSEHLPIDNSASIRHELQDLETALNDPFISKVLRNASEYNEILQIHPISFSEAVSIIEDLDNQWGALMDSNVAITGYVTFLSPEGDRETRFYEEQQMISKGFTMLGTVNEEGLNSGCRIGLQLYLEIPDDKKDA